MNKIYITSLNCIAQFKIDGEFRPRTEYRHGFGNLIADDAEPGFGISTRARLNFGYKNENYTFYLSFQDVLIWGENRQLLPVDSNNSFSIFQAWADIKMGSDWSTKLGRQTIVYDDQRIFGVVGWVQQARNHDAAILKYRKNKFMLDFGLAFNQDKANISGFSSVGNEYSTTGFFSYKTMQYAYLKNNWAAFSGSLLLLNTGFQEFNNSGDSDGTSGLQTFGTHLGYKKGKLGLAGNLFLQTGKRQGKVDVKGAYLASLDLSYKATDKVGLGIGAEVISGNDADAGETGAFFPLYGTNHKFNGFMDYFYVGNHANSIGLVDVHASAKFKIGKSSLLVKVLNFSGEQELPSGEKSLGTELDLVFTKPIKAGKLQIGYSHMFAADGMYELKGISEDLAASGQNWAWVQLTLEPKFLNHTK